MYVLELPRCDNARQDRASQHYIMLVLHKDASECASGAFRTWRFSPFTSRREALPVII
jgi:hypothetical protein